MKQIRKYLKTRLAHDLFLIVLIICYGLMAFKELEKETVIGLVTIVGLVFLLYIFFPSSTEQIILNKFSKKLKEKAKNDNSAKEILDDLNKIIREQN